MIRIDYTNGQGIATNGSGTNCGVEGNFTFVDTFNTLNTCDFLTVDGDGIDLSGTKQFADANVYQGVSSSALSNSTNYTYTSTVTYEGDFSNIKTTGITVTFYYTNITQVGIRAYHDSTQIGVAYSNDTGMSKYVDFSNISGDFSNCNKIQIFSIKTNKNNSRFYIENVAKGNVSRGTFEDIKSHNLIEEINILSTDLPCNQFEAVVAAKQKPAIDSKIEIYSNDVYYGTFWVNEVEQVGKKLQYTSGGETVTVGDDLYAITATNAIALLDRGNFRKWRASCLVDLSNIQTTGAEFVGWAGVRLDEFLTDMQSATGVQVISTDADYNNSSSTSYHAKLGLYGYINRQSYRYNLCAMAYALGYMIDASRNNKVVFKKIPTTVSKTYTNNDIIGTATFNKTPKITKVEYYKYPDANISNIGDIEITSSADPYSKDNTYYFSMPSASTGALVDYEFGSVAVSLPNGEEPTDIANYHIYADRADYTNITKTLWLRFPLELSPTIEVLSVQNASEEYTADHNYFTVQGVRNISTISDTSSKFYWATYKQAFTGTRINRATQITKMAKSGGTVNAKVILTDEKVGDLVTITTDFGEQVTGIITRMNVHFGYNDVADIEVTQYE